MTHLMTRPSEFLALENVSGSPQTEWQTIKGIEVIIHRELGRACVYSWTAMTGDSGGGYEVIPFDYGYFVAWVPDGLIFPEDQMRILPHAHMFLFDAVRAMVAAHLEK